MSDPAPALSPAVLYSRHGCPPCFAMQREARRSARRTGIPLRVVEISDDAALERRFGTEVPVLILPGGETLRGRIAPGQVEEAFRRAAALLSSGSRPTATSGQATRRRTGPLGGFLSILGWRRRPQA